MSGSCHHSNSRQFKCACGSTTWWLQGNNYQACTQCHRYHVRGSDGPKGTVTKCEGVGKFTFSKAVGSARAAFIEEMYRCGFLGSDKEGKLNVKVRGRHPKHDGFTMTWTAHFNGEGPL